MFPRYITFALQISAHPLPRPPGEGRGEGIKNRNLKCDDYKSWSMQPSYEVYSFTLTNT
jgi:hypothetical protein